jgi:hypothetical protein
VFGIDCYGRSRRELLICHCGDFEDGCVSTEISISRGLVRWHGFAYHDHRSKMNLLNMGEIPFSLADYEAELRAAIGPRNWSLVGTWTAELGSEPLVNHYRALWNANGRSTLITISYNYTQKVEGTYTYTYLGDKKGALETASLTGEKQRGEITWINKDQVIYRAGGLHLTYRRERPTAR